MEPGTGNDLPDLPRRVMRVNFGDRARHPALYYSAPADVIARFGRALKNWHPEYTVEVEPVENEPAEVPELPYWNLWAWE
ncbi:hypothetical protein [Nocardia goodfellowii]|uniref:Uncharacterized protein n=1 Tax=Nocardia goodfellowii TaxID=882446 RepID=A0ABS4Q8U9_9NOCA|nr:hypothetical protein [Nocardia goodfellowii]MBP2188023.1 hypothetical protein [Nocardia goodfellowii]